MKVALTIVKGPGQGRVMEFNEPQGFIIGRAKDADFQLSADDPYVSRRHVYLEISPPSCRLRDLGSTNLPSVNGVPSAECELRHGDVIELGYTHLKISVSDSVVPQSNLCRGCGQEMTVGFSDPGPVFCQQCAAPAIRQAPAQPNLSIACACGADLSERANRDGRAEQLRDVAAYACEKCLPPRDEHGGKRIAEYEAVRLLGEGGMGVVYLAYHPPSARVVALKNIKNLTDASLTKRFEREIRLQTKLMHPNIIRCLDTGIDEAGTPYIATEYVTGGDLDDLSCRWRRRLPVSLAVPLICQVLHGLEYLHTQSIIHRDIKPQNILLAGQVSDKFSRYDPLPVPKLTDFGISFSYARAGGTRLTDPGTGMGTLMFMPPEQVRDAAGVRESADTYAMGVTLYYLITGKYTFNFPTSEDVEEIRRQECRNLSAEEALRVYMQKLRIMHPFNIILSEEPVPIQSREATIPDRLAKVVDRAVHKDARLRFRSAAEFRFALEQAME